MTPPHLILAKVRVDRAIQRAIETRADSTAINALVAERGALREQINHFKGLR